MTAPETLYTLSDCARALGVSPSALSNRRKRGQVRVAVPLPAPAYRTRSGAPLFTRAQVEGLLRARMRDARAVLEPVETVDLDRGADSV